MGKEKSGREKEENGEGKEGKGQGLPPKRLAWIRLCTWHQLVRSLRTFHAVDSICTVKS